MAAASSPKFERSDVLPADVSSSARNSPPYPTSHPISPTPLSSAVPVLMAFSSLRSLSFQDLVRRILVLCCLRMDGFVLPPFESTAVFRFQGQWRCQVPWKSLKQSETNCKEISIICWERIDQA